MGLIGAPLSSAALLLLPSSSFSSAVNGTLVSASSLRIGIPGPNSDLWDTPDRVSSLFRVADRLPYQNAKTLNASSKSTPIETPTPIPALAPVDKPPCFKVIGGDGPGVTLPDPEVDLPALGLTVLELRSAVLEFGTVVLEIGLDVLIEFGLDDVEIGIDVLASGLDVLLRVFVGDADGSEA